MVFTPFLKIRILNDELNCLGAAKLVRCEAPETFSQLQNITSLRDGGEKMMTEFSSCGELIL